MRFNAFLSVGVSAVALTLVAASPAIAQSTDPVDAAAEEQTADTSEIVVMAQGRAQALADVPVAISAVNSEALSNSGANDNPQLNQLAPSLIVSSSGSESNGSARIRGIGTVGDNPGLESSVPVFIDGVYRSRSGIGLSELGEIDRVEVQRGPQGTLGGRNSSAGLISIYSKKPQFQFGASGEATYGNYDLVRVAGSVTGPISEQLAARFDGVYVRRDGFMTDPANKIDVNNRNRFFLRGQLLWEPSSDVSVRLIGDYTWRDERCCGAIYVDSSVNPYIGNLNNVASPILQPGLAVADARINDTGNNIVNVLRDLGQNLDAFNQGYDRTLSVTPGRSYAGKVKDYGFSGEVKWDLGGATLTSITAYREYRAGQAGDVDYSTVDILYRADEPDKLYRQFHTFTQELRLQGEAFDGKLDWLVGGFYSDERLIVADNLRFGEDYGQFAACRIVSGTASFAPAYLPTNPGCISALGLGGLALKFNDIPNGVVAGTKLGQALQTLSTLGSPGVNGSLGDVYRQNGKNWALFTHNIFHITDKLDLTLGVRYTNDKKDMNATFANNNTVCTTLQQSLYASDMGTDETAKTLASGILALACQGNSTAELNGKTIATSRSEDEWTGTAILSYRPIDDLMTYASYSRGYKAGGFNLDRSDLKTPALAFGANGPQAYVNNLQFEPELVNSYEIGAKYATGPFSLGVTLFRSDFTSFQLNTFNGSVYTVENINGCKTSLNGADRDADGTTGTCNKNDITWGVRSEGVEVETTLAPADNVRIGAGVTYAKTKYRSDLVGSNTGAALDPSLRLLPGNTMSNAPEMVITTSFSWTPDLGTDGYTGLVYVDSRTTSDYNTGSDLFPQKAQDGYSIVNARFGVRAPEQKWALEFWVQNLFNKDYAQVAFNSPAQAGAGTSLAQIAPFNDLNGYPGNRQLFGQFLGEPRTYGVTLRGKF